MQSIDTVRVRSFLPSSILRDRMSRLLKLRDVSDSNTLSDLVSRQRLVASKTGKTVAVVIAENAFVDCVEHNVPEFAEVYFARQFAGEEIQTRILEVRDDRLVIYGVHAEHGVLGVYECSAECVRLIHPIADVQEFHRTKVGLILIGRSDATVDECRVCTDYGVLSLHSMSQTTVLHDGSILILDLIDERPYRYRLSTKGFQDVLPIRCENEEKPIALARVGSSHVLATQEGIHSHLRLLGNKVSLSFLLQEDWDGEIECLWQSPDGCSLAWLFRPNGQDGFRQLFLNGLCVYEGTFEMTRNDLVWSEKGNTCGAKIFETMASGMIRHVIVTPTMEQEICSGSLVREFLVDASGLVTAYITDSAFFCHPNIRGKSHDPATLAWNLHWLPGNKIGYNFVLLGDVYQRNDDTNRQRLD